MKSIEKLRKEVESSARSVILGVDIKHCINNLETAIKDAISKDKSCNNIMCIIPNELYKAFIDEVIAGGYRMINKDTVYDTVTGQKYFLYAIFW